jgi:hypothetical protein
MWSTVLQGNISKHIALITLLRRIGLRRLWLRLFGGAWLQSKSKLQLSLRKCQRKHAFQVLSSFVVNGSRKHFQTHCLDHSPSQNWIAETVVAFVWGRLASKQVGIAVVSLEMPTRARVPGFELLCGQCSFVINSGTTRIE